MSAVQIASQWQEALSIAQQYTPADKLIVFNTPLPDGTTIPLSRFGDETWLLPPNLFPRCYRNEGQRRIIFSRVPESFRTPFKVCVLRYAHCGIEGRGLVKGTTLINFAKYAKPFLRFVYDLGITDLSKISTMHCAQYVEHCRRQVKTNSKGTSKPASANTLHFRFLAVENLHHLSRFCYQAMPHPWPESSSFFLSGGESQCFKPAKTPVIPDEAMSKLFQSCEARLEKADHLLEMRDRLSGLRSTFSDRRIVRRKFKQMYSNGLVEFEQELKLLLGACMTIVLIGSGMRSHEMGSLDVNCAYTTVDDEGESYFWIRGRSDKTDEGKCSWLVPKVTHRAIEVAERVTRPLREMLLRGAALLQIENAMHHRLADLNAHKNTLFVVRWTNVENHVATMDGSFQNRLLKQLAQYSGIDWHFTTHQFRRTFAVYAVRSALGDLRYLRDHFKHWSIDMTAAYAAAQDRDEELIDEIWLEFRNQKVEAVEHWLEKDSLLSGGMADSIRSFRARSDAVETYKSRRDLATKLSELVSIRATGVAWCTADSGGCNGGQGVEKTRCAGCVNAVIDDRKRPIWQGIYNQQLELAKIDDIGPTGQERVQRDIERCRSVLIDLGATPEDLDEAAAKESR